jgi:putative component of membrane protein insertase Oxa1/YidC/SpoIIIJ protein YidD
MLSMVQYIWRFPRNLVIGMITVYQKTLSPDHGPLRHLFPHGYCMHRPTCSEYAKIVLRERGFFIGTALAIKRVFLCNPWSTPTRLPKM